VGQTRADSVATVEPGSSEQNARDRCFRRNTRSSRLTLELPLSRNRTSAHLRSGFRTRPLAALFSTVERGSDSLMSDNKEHFLRGVAPRCRREDPDGWGATVRKKWCPRNTKEFASVGSTEASKVFTWKKSELLGALS